MKKFLLCALFFSCILSCKKDHKNVALPSANSNKKTYKVHFNILADQSKTSNSVKKSTNSLATSAITNIGGITNTLLYFVYNSQGNLITQLRQDSSTTNYGQISDTFSTGTYTIAIIAGENGPVNYSATGKYFQTGGHDTFFKKFTITVTDDAITQDVNLERIVGQLQVKILDAIPANVTSLQFTFNDTRFSIASSSPDANNTYPLIIGGILPDSVKGTTNYSLTSYVANTTASFPVVITAYDASNKVIGTAQVNDVSCLPNTRTVLSGNLFSGSSEGFTVTFNEVWSPDTTIIHF